MFKTIVFGFLFWAFRSIFQSIRRLNKTRMSEEVRSSLLSGNAVPSRRRILANEWTAFWSTRPLNFVCCRLYLSSPPATCYLSTLNQHGIAGAGLPIHMIGEVSWEPKRRRAWAFQYLIPRWFWYRCVKTTVRICKWTLSLQCIFFASHPFARKSMISKTIFFVLFLLILFCGKNTRLLSPEHVFVYV